MHKEEVLRSKPSVGGPRATCILRIEAGEDKG